MDKAERCKVLTSSYNSGQLIKIGKQIKGRRKELRMSSQQLADQLGISKRQVFRIENGSSDAYIRTVLKIADALNCNPSYLLCDDTRMTPEEMIRSAIMRADVKELIHLYNTYSEITRLIGDHLTNLMKHQNSKQVSNHDDCD